MTAEWLHRFDESTTRFAKLDHTGLQVVQRSFNEIILLLVMSQKVVPKRVLNKKKIGIDYDNQSDQNAPCSGL